ncbi:MAG TPA: biotin/lipoyl-containing protein, partial [Opitutus sp.]|nr:biotin/lipoyl-containing protein [Opitutus sp.]
EIQVFADAHGNCVHLFERDCSVQRRHQKVLEEAPAPGLTEERRREMGAAAIAAARAVGYVGAGTVEFIVDPDGGFYFMEMNTRLQVEHPVTEMITGLDLVEWQLRVAAGELLPLAQVDITRAGHAIEARIYAEDPARDFLPSTGKLGYLSIPEESRHVRVDTGVCAGDTITPHYDPMIAKLIVWDESREQALARMAAALARYRISGVTCNVEFLGRLVTCPAFATGDLDTGLIARESVRLFPERAAVTRDACFAATLAVLAKEVQAVERSGERSSPWVAADGWRLNSVQERTLHFRDGEAERLVQVRYEKTGYRLTLEGSGTVASGMLQGNAALRFTFDGVSGEATVVEEGDRLDVFLHGRKYELVRARAWNGGGETAAGDAGLTAPIPGHVVALLAEPGAFVEQGAPLLVLEAMKMEMTIVAPTAGTVRAFRFPVGAQVAAGAELVEFEKRG